MLSCASKAIHDAEQMAAQFEEQLDRAKGGKRKVTSRRETAPRSPFGTHLTFPERESRQKSNSSLCHDLWPFSGFRGRLGPQNCIFLFSGVFVFLVIFGLFLFLPMGFRVQC